MSGLKVTRNEDESWRDCVKRVAGKQGLAHECLEEFDGMILTGEDEAEAAWSALYEWDCLDLAD